MGAIKYLQGYSIATILTLNTISKGLSFMFNSLFKSFSTIFVLIFILVIFISCFFTPIILSNSNTIFSTENIIFSDISPSGYLWPTPGYTTINSYFGRRNSPTAGATSYHKGIDIGAPEGSKLLAVCNGKITFTGFLGGRRLYYYTFCK